MKSIVEIVNIIKYKSYHQINTIPHTLQEKPQPHQPHHQKQTRSKSIWKSEKRGLVEVEERQGWLKKVPFDFKDVLALIVFLIIRQTTMMHHSRLGMMKAYGSRLRQRITISLRDYSLGKTQQILENLNVQEGEEQEQEVELSEEEVEIEQQPEEDDEKQGDFNLSDYLQMLSRDELAAFKRENPQLPPIFFMSKAEKKRYFEEVNNSFNRKLAKMPQRKSKTKKILKFKNQFEVKPFNQKLKVASLQGVKEVKEKYLPKIHFS